MPLMLFYSSKLKVIDIFRFMVSAVYGQKDLKKQDDQLP